MVNESLLHLFFSHPEPFQRAARIMPVFIPFAGCPGRCIFCSQECQTGVGQRTVQASIDKFAEEIQNFPVSNPQEAMSPDTGCVNSQKKNEKLTQLTVEENTKSSIASENVCLHSLYSIANNEICKSIEVGFFGGTFTAISNAEQLSFLSLANSAKEQGKVSRIRCSTRPDAISPTLLRELGENGLDMVELGIQSFSDRALAASRRGYTGAKALDACRMVLDAGLELGIQLMPGLPGHSRSEALNDCRIAADLRPDNVRLYPCLVFEGTPLAELWREGGYQPWPLDVTTHFLAEVVPWFWDRGIAVIRMGVAPEPAAVQSILAGPFHPALGNMVRGQIIFSLISRKVEEFRGQCPSGHRLFLHVPRRYQGEFWGHRASLVSAYAGLGLERDQVQWTDAGPFRLSWA